VKEVVVGASGEAIYRAAHHPYFLIMYNAGCRDVLLEYNCRRVLFPEQRILHLGDVAERESSLITRCSK